MMTPIKKFNFKNKKVCSFDVFDTCLVRKCGEPKYVFFYVASELFGHKDYSKIAEFIRLRIDAETKAKKENEYKDVNLEKIYSNFHDVKFLGRSAKEAALIEIEVENKMIQPVWEMKEIVKDARKRGLKIIFISDMYLPHDFIERKLKEFGFLEKSDSLFVSGNVGEKKRSGKLFLHIAREMKIKFSDWVHFGNDKEADFKVPKKLGIDARLVIEDFSRYEKRWLKDAAFSKSNIQMAMVAGIARSIRLKEKSSPSVDFSVDVAAPLLVYLVVKILEHAKKHGKKRLLFLARDGYIFYKIAEVLVKRYPGIEIGYIYLNRRILYLPGLKTGSKEELKEIFHVAVSYTPKQVFEALNFPESIFLKNFQDSNLPADFFNTKLTREDLGLLMDFLSKGKANKDLMDEVVKQRKILARYLKQEKLSEDNVAIVDSGWGLNCQKAINVVLDYLGKAPVYGYYYGVIPTRKNMSVAGEYWSAYLPELEFNDKLGSMLEEAHSKAMVEQVFAATNFGSVIKLSDKGGKIIPILATPEKKTDNVLAFLGTMNKTVLEFTKEIYENNLDIDLFREIGLKSMVQFLEAPADKELRLLENFMITSIGAGVNDEQIFLTKVSKAQMLRAIFGLGKFPATGWHSGTLQLSLGRRLYLIGRSIHKVIFYKRNHRNKTQLS